MVFGGTRLPAGQSIPPAVHAARPTFAPHPTFNSTARCRRRYGRYGGYMYVCWVLLVSTICCACLLLLQACSCTLLVTVLQAA
jgi:hypothetical protein